MLSCITRDSTAPPSVSDTSPTSLANEIPPVDLALFSLHTDSTARPTQPQAQLSPTALGHMPLFSTGAETVVTISPDNLQEGVSAMNTSGAYNPIYGTMDAAGLGYGTGGTDMDWTQWSSM